jgi:hypothetical protein
MYAQQFIRSIALLSAIYSISGFMTPQPVITQTTLSSNGPSFINAKATPTTTGFQTVLMAKNDASKSGSKRERLNKLADLEDSRIETDKSAVLKAAGGFVGLCVILLTAAYFGGVFDDLIVNGPY